MRIGVDARFLQTDEILLHMSYTHKVIVSLARQYDEHQFIFFLDCAINSPVCLPENVSTVIITPAPTNLLLLKWWYDIKVPLALKKYRADTFIGTYGLCSLTTKVRQLLIVHDLAFLHYPVSLSKQNLLFYKKFTSLFLKKAAAIAVFSDFIKKEIIGKYAISDQKITVTSLAADNSFQPLSWEEREKVKEQYAEGCDYFVFTGGLDPKKNIINLLKAFSIFKKWQKTNMKLVVAGNIEKYKDQVEKLNSYKYKNEIHLTANLSEEDLAKITAGAYAMIFPSFYEGFGMPALEAMQCEVPVITSVDGSMAEIAGDAALYVNLEDPAEIAEQMKRIFKDEQLRNKLIAAGKERVKIYNMDKTIALTWQAVEKAVSK